MSQQGEGQAQQGQQGQQGAQQGQQSAQGAQGGQAGGIDGQELSKKFSEGYNTGVQKAEKDLSNELVKRFGATNLDDLEKVVKEARSKGHPDQVAQIDTLTRQMTEREQAHAAERLNWRIQNAMAGLTPHSPALTAQQIQQQFEIQIDEAGRETIYPKGSREIVVLDGKPATLRDLVQSLAKKPEYAWQFGSAGTNVQPGQVQSTFNDGMLKDPKFVQALRSAGEYFNFINGRPVNEAAVLALMNKN